MTVLRREPWLGWSQGAPLKEPRHDIDSAADATSLQLTSLVCLVLHSAGICSNKCSTYTCDAHVRAGKVRIARTV